MLPFSIAYQTERVKLFDQVPLDLPLCICIEPTNVCNFRCLMCWQSTDEYRQNGGPFQNMDMELFQITLRSMQEFCRKKKGKIKLIKLYSAGEPLLNRNIGTMLKEIKEADISQQVEITSNAALLTPELAKAMVDYGLDYFRASIYSVDPENHKRITKAEVTPEQIRENIAYLHAYRKAQGKYKPYICAKIIDTHTNENEAFKRLYENISDEQLIDVPWIVPKLRENALGKLYGSVSEGAVAQEKYISQAGGNNRKVCRYPFTHMTVRSNGDVVVCCTDWPRDTLLGNVREKSLESIWNSPELYRFRVMQLTTKGENHPLCSTCEIPLQGTPEDSLEKFPVERLLHRM